MRLIRPYTEIMQFTCSPELIELAGRTCYQSEPKGNSEAFVKMLLSRTHESVIEHSMVTVKFVIDRGVSHELVRHRLMSISQESTRYCRYGKDGHVTFVIPPWVAIEPDEYEQDEVYYGTPADETWFDAILRAERMYLQLLEDGWGPQQARSVLPNSLKTEIVVTANAREWRHIFRLRCDKAAHPQMREVMCPLLREFHARVPVLFQDILQNTQGASECGSNESSSKTSASTDISTGPCTTVSSELSDTTAMESPTH
jgi:thymidylate synthase (FAD)